MNQQPTITNFGLTWQIDTRTVNEHYSAIGKNFNAHILALRSGYKVTIYGDRGEQLFQALGYNTYVEAMEATSQVLISEGMI